MKNQENQRLQSLLPAIIAAIFMLGAFGSAFAQKKGAATEAEIKAYFVKRNKDSTEGMGWKNPQVTFQSIKIAAPVKYNFVDVGVQTSYPVKISWTASYDNYNSTYTVVTTGDFYRFYRNEFGDLTMGEHGGYENQKATNTPLGADKPADKPVAQADKQMSKKSTETTAKTDGENPAPDTSAMDKWYEITKYEYGDFTVEPKLTLWFKPKVGHYDRPSFGAFKVAFLDKDGVEVTGFAHSMDVDYGTEIGEVGQAMVKAPTEKQMEKVVSVKVIRNKE